MYAGLDSNGGSVFQYYEKREDLLEKYNDNNRLYVLGLLNIYREKQISADTVLNIFSRRKERKWSLIFQD